MASAFRIQLRGRVQEDRLADSAPCIRKKIRIASSWRFKALQNNPWCAQVQALPARYAEQLFAGRLVVEATSHSKCQLVRIAHPVKPRIPVLGENPGQALVGYRGVKHRLVGLVFERCVKIKNSWFQGLVYIAAEKACFAIEVNRAVQRNRGNHAAGRCGCPWCLALQVVVGGLHRDSGRE